MSYHRLTNMACPPELIGFGNGSMQLAETPERMILDALRAIVADYENQDISHAEFRVRACQLAGNAISIFATAESKTYAGIPMDELARSGAFVWHPGDEA